jgi:hypothetical protein
MKIQNGGRIFYTHNRCKMADESLMLLALEDKIVALNIFDMLFFINNLSTQRVFLWNVCINQNVLLLYCRISLQELFCDSWNVKKSHAPGFLGAPDSPMFLGSALCLTVAPLCINHT